MATFYTCGIVSAGKLQRQAGKAGQASQAPAARCARRTDIGLGVWQRGQRS